MKQNLKHKFTFYNKHGEVIDPFNYKAPEEIVKALQVVLRKGGVKWKSYKKESMKLLMKL